MLIRMVPMLALVVLLGACSSNNDSWDSQSPTLSEREDITQGPIYGTQGYGNDAYNGSASSVPGVVGEATQQDFANNVGDRIFFGYDRYDLSSDARETLQRQAEWLQAFSGVSITVEGHADERGTREYNLALGDRRANSVRNYLVSLGVHPARVNTISYGKERPAVLGSNDSAWAQNRRGVSRLD